ncbi:hypothetical protein, partial [Thiolapillus sp.]|uniref:hypothetical protein n=1 Tax=Thiolapillus sp. TaxID=2017437 RepID=UPI003AF8CFBF
MMLQFRKIFGPHKAVSPQEKYTGLSPIRIPRFRQIGQDFPQFRIGVIVLSVNYTNGGFFGGARRNDL